MNAIFRPAIVLFFLLTLICALLYPYVVTVIGQFAFAHQVAGSMVIREGQVVGSSLIGQTFSSANYFWGRPSATSPMPNNAQASGGSNLGPDNPAKITSISARVKALQAIDPGNTALIPIDLVTTSASGLDPDISLAAAYYQASRIARERQLPIERIHSLIAEQSKFPHLRFFGEPRVNVLLLNLALDELK